MFVYASSPIMALIGAFEVGEVVAGAPPLIWRRFNGRSGMAKGEFDAYFKERRLAFAISIRKYWRLATPIHLTELREKREGFHPPQGYHYVCSEAFGRIARVGARAPRLGQHLADSSAGTASGSGALSRPPSQPWP